MDTSGPRDLSLLVEFSVDDMPARWWPMGREETAGLDPARSFGQPIVNDGGVPTTVLADA